MIGKKYIYIFSLVVFGAISNMFAQKSLPGVLEYNNGKTIEGMMKMKL